MVMMAEVKTLNDHNDKLITALSLEPSNIASELLAESFIPFSVVDEMLVLGVTDRQKASKLVTAVRSAVEINPQNYHVFVSVLKNESSRKHIVKILTDSYQSNVKQLEDESVRRRRRPNEGKQSSRTATDDSGDHESSTIPNHPHNQGQPRPYFSTLCISLCVIAFCIGLIGVGVHQWKSVIDGAISPSKDEPAAKVRPTDSNQESTGTKVPSPDPNVNLNKVCQKIFTDHLGELTEIISSHGSAKQWCAYLGISESTCNSLDYSRQHQNDIILDVTKAYLDENLNPCWEDIVRILCKTLKKNKAALKLSEKHSVNYSSQCG